MKKRIVSLALALMMCFSLSTTAFATDTGSTRTIFNEMYGFVITETTNAEGHVIRTYCKQNSMARSYSLTNNDPYAETKALLADMGMGSEFIAKLSNEQLERYANSPSLTSMSSYLRTDNENHTIFLDKETAIEEATAINEQKEHTTITQMTGSVTPYIYADEEYDYMSIYLLIMYDNDGVYNYTVDAQWLTMPDTRSTDSIGACADENGVINNTRYGWYEYDTATVSNSGSLVRDSVYGQISSFKQATNGSWNGSVALVTLPKDTQTTLQAIINSNYRVHYEFDMKVKHHTQEVSFGATGAYSHADTNIILSSPSIGIDNECSPSYSIGLEISQDVVEYIVELPTLIDYVPD